MSLFDYKAKEYNLRKLIRNYGKMVVAFSGGVDSTLLAGIAHQELGCHMTAVTIDSPFISRKEIKEIIDVAAQLKMSHQLIKHENKEVVLKNPSNRCYHCKLDGFKKIVEYAQMRQIDCVADGMNADDLQDYRPGAQANKELSICSPLQEVGFTKNEIRAFAKKLGLSTWDQPSNACLASRIPYGDYITVEKLKRIEMAEDFLHDVGFRLVRVRDHRGIARIEVAGSQRNLFFSNATMDKVAVYLKKLGFQYITLDLSGYMMGSLNGPDVNKIGVSHGLVFS